ncbi:MAG: hypothetical protein KA248_06490 [Kiritimatiellae bacterium]|nr:hypothetical protein [Kiritimatiellia bacterium]
MARKPYSVELVADLNRAAADPSLEIPRRPSRYEAGQALDLEVEGVFPAVRAAASFRIEKFLGGGFAGQVYRCRLDSLRLPAGAEIPGLAPGRVYTLKIIIPPSRFSRFFRNFVYRLAFQGPFSAQVNYSACRAGLLWQKLMRRAARAVFGRETAVKDAYASFHDATLGAFGEVTEWIEGRMWRLESDPDMKARRDWRNVPIEATASAEYVAKRRFMADLVRMLHEMGAPEFARQYEWYTMKSQPNVLKRTDTGEEGPAGGLCAIDFRAGLALLPFLPMSPADFKLILQGLFRRGALVQFDRGDLGKLEHFAARHAAEFEEYRPVLEELKVRDPAYRRSLPDLTHHGLRLLWDAGLRRDVRAGLVEGYRADDLADERFAEALRTGSGFRFAAWYLLGAVPILGRLIRKRWGNAAYRRHVGRLLTSWSYFKIAARTKAAHELVEWHRKGRAGEPHARFLAARPGRFYLERFTLGILPFAGLHRVIVEPRVLWEGLRGFLRTIKQFIVSAEFREKWFLDTIADGEREGMLTRAEAESISAQVRDPFIVKYLKCLGVHFATLPVTQIVSVSLGLIVAGWMIAHGKGWGEATVAFAGIVALFQVIPISPGSLCRGGFVVYLMIKERNVKDYLIAAPLSFAKYIGYLAFPLQMTATYPQLARFMASRWATSMVHIVPVFGEQGALLEHWVFDLFFNWPQRFARWAKPRLRGLLTAWAALGIALAAALIHFLEIEPLKKTGINLLILTVCLFVLPRVLFYPLLARRRASPDQGPSGGSTTMR